MFFIAGEIKTGNNCLWDGKMKKQHKDIASTVSNVGIFGNIILSLLKFAAGILGKSRAMISDAVHSLSDVFSTVIVMIGIRISRKEADEDHPYGHDRFECVAAEVLAIILVVTACFIGYTSIQHMIAGDYETFPGPVSLWMAAVSVAVKEAMYWYTVINARKTGSVALMASAWHHRSDALSSVGSFIGIFFARKGYYFMDPLAGIVICLFIFKAAYDIFKQAVDEMVDRSISEEEQEKIKGEVLSVEGVERIDLFSTRQFGSGAYIDIEIAVDGDMSLRDSHAIAENVHDLIERDFADVKHIMVHVNPL